MRTLSRNGVPLAILLAVAGLALSTARVEAASGNADGTYTVTVTMVEVSKDSGTTYMTVFSGSQSINIASVSAGAVAAGLVSGVTMDVGTYDRIRVTIGSTLQLKGYVNNGATTIFTDGSTFSTNGAAADAPGGTYAVSSFAIPAGSRTSTTTVSIPVQPGGAPTVSVAFDTSGVLTQSGGTPSVGAPTVTITSQ